ncbi:MAG: GNAT family N-acetyltransferase [Planctomycetes bacterium]|nr:GNAT family N-acetyltransferase [Planctomycetota bacterium]
MAFIRKLEPTDDVSGFQSGNSDLDRYLHRYAQVNQFDYRINVTYLAIEAGEIVGYATVASAQGRASDFDSLKQKKLPGYLLPMLRLARSAVAKAWQRKGIGAHLLRHVFGLALKMAGETGCVGIVVDSKPPSVGYYRRLDFEPMEVVGGHVRAPESLLVMFLPIRKVIMALGTWPRA